MHLTVQIKLQPTSEQCDSLHRTLTECNAAADWISARAHKTRTYRRFNLHHVVYHEARKRFALSADATCLAIGRVSACYRRRRDIQHRFRPAGAVSFNSGVLKIGKNSVSIWTVDGRQTMPFVCGERQRALLGGQHGESDLVYRGKDFYLLISIVTDTPETYNPTGFLGVDLGIINIATDSDGVFYTGAQLNGLRRRHRRLRGKLQRKRSRAAKRLLRHRSRKEHRMAKHVNHCISKQLVAKAERTDCGIALENLKGIRERIRVRRSQRATLHSWAFAQLIAFVDYKAALVGVPVVYVDPRNTSRMCPACGHIDKANRPSQEIFKCVECGFAGPADYIAACNIASRAAVNQPNLTSECVDFTHDV